ncbi:MAG: hypothetical protein GY795_21575 [Desulfobacterales bacterium]|nr:hypothetical protein [Desulfobacterales bacterium]
MDANEKKDILLNPGQISFNKINKINAGSKSFEYYSDHTASIKRLLEDLEEGEIKDSIKKFGDGNVI